MGIKLSIEITSPLDPADRDLLSGIAVMTLAIANRELAQQGFPDTFPPEDNPDQPEPPKDEEYEAGQAQPCGHLEMTMSDQSHVMEATGGVCISPVGHRGRHKYRTLSGANIRVEGLN